jgi:hypothetical protein
MQRLLSKLSYANVVATTALFLALGGGAVVAAAQLGKNTVKSQNIARNAVKTQDIARRAVKASKLAANAVKNKNLAKNSVTAGKVKKGTLTRTQLAAGTLAGLQVADAQATNVPGLGSSPPNSNGVGIPLTGTAAFTPVAGKSYELLAELRGTAVDADGLGGETCFTGVQIFVNGEPTTFVGMNANAGGEPPFATNSVGNASTGVGLLSTGTQTITAASYGESDCAGTTANLRVTVVELG